MAKTQRNQPLSVISDGDLEAQLPLWAEKVRGLPHSFARSALFSVGSRSERKNLKNARIAALNDTVILYTGSELRQDDEDVFLQLVHLARGRPVADFVDFTAYSMLKELGWGHSSKSYTRLKECIDRLKANSLKVEVKNADRKGVFSGSMIRKFISTEKDGAWQTWKVWFEKEIVALFGVMSYSELEWAQRTRLRGDITKWLHGFYVTLNECPPMSVESLRSLCGSRCASINAYRQMLRKSLTELEAVGFLCEWKVDRDYVYVSRDRTRPINRYRPANVLEGLQNDLNID